MFQKRQPASAKAAFPKGNAYLTLRDEMGAPYSDEIFRPLFSKRGQSAYSPGILSVVTILQFVEGLSDRQAADAVRSWIDWKYLLGMELTDPGFDASVLSEFRGRIVAGELEEQFLIFWLERMKAKGLLKSRGRQRTDSTHVYAAIRQMNRIELVGETLRATLNELARLEPEWLKQLVPVEWYERYSTRFEMYRLPKTEPQQKQYALEIGRDGYQLMNWVCAAGSPFQLKQVPALKILWQVWIQEYYLQDDEPQWREPDNRPFGEQRIVSPYDPEARCSKKRETKWDGYKAHFTEVCDEDQPHLITHVETTSACLPDNQVTERIHQALEDKDLLPQEHLLDTGYVDAKLLVDSQKQYDVEMVGPVMPDTSWQARTGSGFDISCFIIDWEARQVTCPRQQVSTSWSLTQDNQGNPIIQVEFRKSTCHACSAREHCTQASNSGRKMRFRPQAEHEALQHMRQIQTTPEFLSRYNKRVGIEATLSLGVRSFDLRRCRYIGLAKTRLQNILIAVAINFTRVSSWLRGIPLAVTRTSSFASLAPASG